LREFSPESYMFIVGAFAYTYGLPLYFFDFGYLAMIGDAVKLSGLLILIRMLSR